MSQLEVACAIIEHEGEVLIAQRGPTQQHAGKWEFLGGKLNPGEAAETAVVREIAEEFAMKIDVVERLPTVTYGEIVLIPFRCWVQVRTFSCMEHQAIRWISPASLLDFDLTSPDIPIAKARLTNNYADPTSEKAHVARYTRLFFLASMPVLSVAEVKNNGVNFSHLFIWRA